MEEPAFRFLQLVVLVLVSKILTIYRVIFHIVYILAIYAAGWAMHAVVYVYFDHKINTAALCVPFFL